MTYQDVKDICRMNKLSVQLIASEVGLTLDGLKKGLNNQSLAIRYIVPLCKSLCVTPNRLFGTPDPIQRTITQTQNGGSNNRQVAGTDTDAMRQQLAEKDAQISRLLGIIEKLNN